MSVLQSDAVDPSFLEIGMLSLDIRGRRLWDAEGRRIALTQSEMDLLLVLVSWKGRPLSRNEIRLATRGRPAGPYDRSVDIMVLRLRRKLGAYASLIRTVPNAGYLIDV